MKSTSRMTKRMFTILLGLIVVVFASETFAQGTWVTKAPMPTARYQLAAGVVNGRLYAVGGARGASPTVFTPAVVAYDPSMNTWTTGASMSVLRKNHAAGVVNGVIYLVGGDDDATFIAPVEAYDPASDTGASGRRSPRRGTPPRPAW